MEDYFNTRVRGPAPFASRCLLSACHRQTMRPVLAGGGASGIFV